MIGSRAFKGSLGDERRADVDVRTEKVEEVLRLFGCFDGDEDEEEVRRGERLGNLKLEIKEKERAVGGDLKLGEWIGPSNAIEGYIPQLDRGINSLKEIICFITEHKGGIIDKDLLLLSNSFWVIKKCSMVKS